MKKFVLLITALSFVSEAATNPVIFPYPLMRMKSYEIQVHGQTYSDYYLSQHPSPQNEQKLLDYFETAQKHFAINSKDLAQVYYKKMVDMMFLDDWNAHQRQAITLALLRLAEIDSEEAWLIKALSFGSDIDFNKLPISDSIKNKMKHMPRLPSTDWELSSWSDSFDYVLVNGRVVDLRKTKKIILPRGEYRIVFISSYFVPQTLQVTYQQIPLLQPVQIPFVSGSCKYPILQIDISPSKEILFPDCHLVSENKKWVSKNKDLLPDVNPSSPLTSVYVEAEKKSIYKNPWFWVGVGVVTSVVVYYVHQKSKGESSAPSSTVIGEF